MKRNTFLKRVAFSMSLILIFSNSNLVVNADSKSELIKTEILLYEIEDLNGDYTKDGVTIVRNFTETFSGTSNTDLEDGDLIITDKNTYAYLELDEGIIIKMDRGTSVKIIKNSKDNLEIFITSGSVYFNTNGNIETNQLITFSTPEGILKASKAEGVIEVLNESVNVWNFSGNIYGYKAATDLNFDFEIKSLQYYNGKENNIKPDSKDNMSVFTKEMVIEILNQKFELPEGLNDLDDFDPELYRESELAILELVKNQDKLKELLNLNEDELFDQFKKETENIKQEEIDGFLLSEGNVNEKTSASNGADNNSNESTSEITVTTIEELESAFSNNKHKTIILNGEITLSKDLALNVSGGVFKNFVSSTNKTFINKGTINLNGFDINLTNVDIFNYGSIFEDDTNSYRGKVIVYGNSAIVNGQNINYDFAGNNFPKFNATIEVKPSSTVDILNYSEFKTVGNGISNFGVINEFTNRGTISSIYNNAQINNFTNYGKFFSSTGNSVYNDAKGIIGGDSSISKKLTNEGIINKFFNDGNVYGYNGNQPTEGADGSKIYQVTGALINTTDIAVSNIDDLKKAIAGDYSTITVYGNVSLNSDLLIKTETSTGLLSYFKTDTKRKFINMGNIYLRGFDLNFTDVEIVNYGTINEEVNSNVSSKGKVVLKGNTSLINGENGKNYDYSSANYPKLNTTIEVSNGATVDSILNYGEMIASANAISNLGTVSEITNNGRMSSAMNVIYNNSNVLNFINIGRISSTQGKAIYNDGTFGVVDSVSQKFTNNGSIDTVHNDGKINGYNGDYPSKGVTGLNFDNIKLEDLEELDGLVVHNLDEFTKALSSNSKTIIIDDTANITLTEKLKVNKVKVINKGVINLDNSEDLELYGVEFINLGTINEDYLTEIYYKRGKINLYDDSSFTNGSVNNSNAKFNATLEIQNNQKVGSIVNYAVVNTNNCFISNLGTISKIYNAETGVIKNVDINDSYLIYNASNIDEFVNGGVMESTSNIIFNASGYVKKITNNGYLDAKAAAIENAGLTGEIAEIINNKDISGKNAIKNNGVVINTITNNGKLYGTEYAISLLGSSKINNITNALNGSISSKSKAYSIYNDNASTIGIVDDANNNFTNFGSIEKIYNQGRIYGYNGKQPSISVDGDNSSDILSANNKNAEVSVRNLTELKAAIESLRYTKIIIDESATITLDSDLTYDFVDNSGFLKNASNSEFVNKGVIKLKNYNLTFNGINVTNLGTIIEDKSFSYDEKGKICLGYNSKITNGDSSVEYDLNASDVPFINATIKVLDSASDILNYGKIDATTYSIDVEGSLSKITNYGEITQTIYNNAGTVNTILNEEDALISGDNLILNVNEGSISKITNSGEMNAVGAGIKNDGSTIENLENFGDMSSQTGNVIYNNKNTALIKNLLNDGTITGKMSAIYNVSGTILSLNNDKDGLLTASNEFGISIINDGIGLIEKLTNSGEIDHSILNNGDGTEGNLNNSVIGSLDSSSKAFKNNGVINSINNNGNIFGYYGENPTKGAIGNNAQDVLKAEVKNAEKEIALNDELAATLVGLDSYEKIVTSNIPDENVTVEIVRTAETNQTVEMYEAPEISLTAKMYYADQMTRTANASRLVETNKMAELDVDDETTKVASLDEQMISNM